MQPQIYVKFFLKRVYFDTNLTKEVKDLCTENYETLKEIKENLNKWKDSSCSQTEILNIFKMAIFPNLIYRFSTISVKILNVIFADMDKLILKFIRK